MRVAMCGIISLSATSNQNEGK